MQNFFRITGIDHRLLLLIPLSTVLTVIGAACASWFGAGAQTDMLGIIPMFALAGLWLAVHLLPTTLPWALGCWVAARIVCWKLGLSERVSAVGSGCVAGLGTVMLAFGGPQNIADTMMVQLCIISALSGAIAAALVYRKRAFGGGRSEVAAPHDQNPHCGPYGHVVFSGKLRDAEDVVCICLEPGLNYGFHLGAPGAPAKISFSCDGLLVRGDHDWTRIDGTDWTSIAMSHQGQGYKVWVSRPDTSNDLPLGRLEIGGDDITTLEFEPGSILHDLPFA